MHCDLLSNDVLHNFALYSVQILDCVQIDFAFPRKDFSHLFHWTHFTSWSQLLENKFFFFFAFLLCNVFLYGIILKMRFEIRSFKTFGGCVMVSEIELSSIWWKFFAVWFDHGQKISSLLWNDEMWLVMNFHAQIEGFCLKWMQFCYEEIK